jgi:hypothetical protein
LTQLSSQYKVPASQGSGRNFFSIALAQSNISHMTQVPGRRTLKELEHANPIAD